MCFVQYVLLLSVYVSLYKWNHEVSSLFFKVCAYVCVHVFVCFLTQLCFEVHAVGFVPITSSCQLLRKKQKKQ